MRRKYIAETETYFEKLKPLIEFMYEHPELGNQEREACKRHVSILREEGFNLEVPYFDLETAYKAVYDTNKPGPTIAFMCEYDALPDIGHGCGHNLIGAVSLCAAMVLKQHMNRLGGKIIVFGTPAEESDGAKVDLASGGAFDGVDVALMAHPADSTHICVSSLAMEALAFTFKGRAAHAAACPELGINALDAVIGMFNSISALRQHLPTSVKVHGIITKGGVAANIVPELAVANFYVRAQTKSELAEVAEKVKNCARGAALATGTTLEITHYEKSYDNFVCNSVLNDILYDRFEVYEVPNCEREVINLGSLDAGNVSQICPTAHPMYSISEGPMPIHTKDFADLTVTDFAYTSSKRVVAALVDTAVYLIEHPEVLENVKDVFKKTIK